MQRAIDAAHVGQHVAGGGLCQRINGTRALHCAAGSCAQYAASRCRVHTRSQRDTASRCERAAPQVVEPFALQLAAHAALTAAAAGKPTTRTLHSDLVFHLSPTNHVRGGARWRGAHYLRELLRAHRYCTPGYFQITESLRRFGVGGDTRALLVARFDGTDEEAREAAAACRRGHLADVVARSHLCAVCGGVRARARHAAAALAPGCRRRRRRSAQGARAGRQCGSPAGAGATQRGAD